MKSKVVLEEVFDDNSVMRVYDNHTVRYWERTQWETLCELDTELWNDSLVDIAEGLYEKAFGPFDYSALDQNSHGG